MHRLRILAVILLLHGLLLWLLASGFRLRFEPMQPGIVSIPITLLPPVAPVEVPESPVVPPQPARGRPAAAPITQPVAPAMEPAAPSPTPPAPTVDWAGEASLAARRAVESLSAPKQETFSPPPEPLSKPCVPKKKSMEWNGEDDRRVGLTGGVPYVRVGNCVLLLGVLPTCTFGAQEVTGHLLDDMRDPDRSPSSVPDPDICD